MCLAIPMKLLEKTDSEGMVEMGGVKRRVSLILYPDAAVGDYVLVHAGYVIGIVDEEEAQETLKMLREMASESE